MEKQRATLSILVDNNAGVLSRVVGLFSRRGYNIDSLTVSATNDPAISRITISILGDKPVLDQIIRQTEKLVETRAIVLLDPEYSIQRELLLVKIEADDPMRGNIREIANIYKANIVDLSAESLVVELTGKPSKIDAFLTVIGKYKILEMCRTGVTALGRGNTVLTDNKDIFGHIYAISKRENVGPGGIAPSGPDQK